MRSLGRVVLSVGVFLAAVSPCRQAPAAPISTAPRPPTPPPTGIFPPRDKVPCTAVPLVAHYRFDDALVDATGANPAFAPGSVAPSFTTGRLGKALAIAKGATATAMMTAAMPARWTISHWVRQDNFPALDTNGGIVMVGNDAALTLRLPPSDKDWGKSGHMAHSVTAHVVGSTSSSPHLRVNLVLVTSQLATWVHFAETWDGTTARVYKNGSEIGVGVYKAETDPGRARPKMWTVGEPPTQKNTFEGAIDDLRVYAVALTQAQLQALATATGSDPLVECPKTY